MHTYFILNKTDARLKIGRSCNPSRRLRDLQVATGAPLTLLGVLEGDRERDLHRQFQPYRLTGEWFTWCAEVRTYGLGVAQVPYACGTEYCLFLHAPGTSALREKLLTMLREIVWWSDPFGTVGLSAFVWTGTAFTCVLSDVRDCQEDVEPSPVAGGGCIEMTQVIQ